MAIRTKLKCLPASYLALVIFASVSLLSACSDNVDTAVQVQLTEPDLAEAFAALEGSGNGLPTHKTSVAMNTLIQQSDAAVPALHAKLNEVGKRLKEMKANQRTDESGRVNYDHLDAQAEQKSRSQWATANLMQSRIIQVLQKIDTPQSKQVLETYFESEQLAFNPIEIVANSQSKPAAVATGLEYLLWCGQFDVQVQKLAGERMSVGQHRRVRGLAAHLAVRSGLETQALPILKELLDSPHPGPDGRDLHVLLALAQLYSPRELEAIVNKRTFVPKDLQLAMDVANFVHAKDSDKYALMDERRSESATSNDLLDLYFANHMLSNADGARLKEFGYARPGLPREYAITDRNARLFATLGYSVSLDGEQVNIERRSCW